MQSTISRSLSFRGVGLHSGLPVKLTLRPAPSEFGIRFCRIDVADRDQIVPARWDLVSDTRLATRLSNADGVSVSTVEHLMAALGAFGVDNLLIDIDGPEAPILDGSAQPYVDAIAAAGLVWTTGRRRAIAVLAPIEVARGDASAALLPADRFEAGFTIDFPDRAIGRQALGLAVTPESFALELADCRTFVRLAEVEALRKAGLALGGGLENAVVVDGARVLNRGGLRRPDEFVRHKLLDAIGDLALAGAPILARYEGVKAGHEINNLLLRRLFERFDAWAWVDAPPATPPVPAFEDEAQRLAAE
jgi:UDP-3-O-[3-hydroxymyristoyl] N-acetylglucosamine deacetylase